MWDDWHLTDTAIVDVDHDPADGVWSLVAAVAAATAADGADLDPSTAALLHEFMASWAAPA